MTSLSERVAGTRGELGICVVNYRSRELIGSLIESLAGASGSAALRITCVDNSESDDEFQGLRRLEPLAARLGVAFTAIRSPRNVGYAAGNNLAARSLVADGVDTLLVVNPDVTVRAGTLDTLCRLTGGPAPAIYTVLTTRGDEHYNGLSQLNRWTSSSAHASDRQSAGAVQSRVIVYPGGHFLAMSTSTWLRLGGLCQDFFLFGEEADLAVRALAAGVAVETTDLISVEHQIGATTGATAVVARKTSTTLRQASRSAVIFSRKHNSYRTPTVVLSRLVLALLVLIRLGGGASREVLAGVLAGLRAPLTSAVIATARPAALAKGALGCSSR